MMDKRLKIRLGFVFIFAMIFLAPLIMRFYACVIVFYCER